MKVAVLFVCIVFAATAALEAADSEHVIFKERKIAPALSKNQIAWHESVVFSADSRRLGISIGHKGWALALKRQAEMAVIDLSKPDEAPKRVVLGEMDHPSFDSCIYECYGAGIAPSFSNDGTRLLTLLPRWAPAPPALTVTDVLTSKSYKTLQYDQQMLIKQFAFSGDQRNFAVAGGTRTRVPEGLPASGLICYQPGEVCVWNLETGDLRFRHRDETAGFFAVVFSPTGDIVAAGGGQTCGIRDSGRVVLLDTATGEIRHTLKGHSRPVQCIAFTPDGKTIVSCVDCSMHFWDVATGRETANVPVGVRRSPWIIQHLSFSSDGRLIAVAMSNWNRGQKGGEIRVFDAGDKSTVAILFTDSGGPITSIAFSPNGKMLAACNRDELRLWDVAGLGP